jgi:hypothetical protein
MPILGVVDSGKSGHLVTSSFESIATVTTGGTSTITFSSIPQTYKHLQIRYTARSNRYSYYIDDTFALQVNGYNSTDQYMWHTIDGNGAYSSVNATHGYTGSNTDRISLVPIPAQRLGDNNIYSAGIVDVFDYSSSTKNKTIKQISGADGNSANLSTIELGSGFCVVNTNAITSISFFGIASTIGTFALYGIQG